MTHSLPARDQRTASDPSVRNPFACLDSSLSFLRFEVSLWGTYRLDLGAKVKSDSRGAQRTSMPRARTAGSELRYFERVGPCACLCGDLGALLVFMPAPTNPNQSGKTKAFRKGGLDTSQSSVLLVVEGRVHPFQPGTESLLGLARALD